MAESLAKWNIIPGKTYGMDTAVIPEAHPIDFLRGVIDGDGSIYCSGKSWHVSICGHGHALIAQIVTAICQHTGAAPHTITLYRGVFRHTWNGTEARRVLQILYPQDSTCVIARKMAKAR